MGWEDSQHFVFDRRFLALGQRNSSAKHRVTPAGRFADKLSEVWSRARSQAVPLMYSRTLCKPPRDTDLSACYPLGHLSCHSCPYCWRPEKQVAWNDPPRAVPRGAHFLLSSSVPVLAVEERGRGNRGLGQVSKSQPASSRGAKGETGLILQEWETHK